MEALKHIAKLLFPPRCVFCRKITDGEGTCAECRPKLPYCGSVTKKIEFCDKCAAPFYYTDVVRASLLRFKFRGRRGYAPEYAAYVADEIGKELSGMFDVITWVPISEKRFRKRGYDQSRLIAEETAKILGVSAEKLLTKIRDNPAQSSLGDRARRRANVAGVYEAVSKEKVRGKRVLIIDDIVTTGATLSECARTLLMAGAESVVCAAAASTPEKKKHS